MDHRHFKRHPGNQPASITLFGTPETRIPGRIRNISGQGMGIEVGQPVESGTELKIEVPRTALLGKAIYCRPDGDRFYIGVRLDEPLRTLIAMSRALEELHTPANLQTACVQAPQKPH
ncbi:MAG TPA: PilZ domain-containing protein [Candidatus Acidoferrales bacterium]|nr:PilZ domain-containing protein [Candidatus Acidoferrales bacterium]